MKMICPRCVAVALGERHRGRERERDKEGGRDRETWREGERERDKEGGGERDNEGGREKYGKGERWRGKEKEIHSVQFTCTVLRNNASPLCFTVKTRMQQECKTKKQ